MLFGLEMGIFFGLNFIISAQAQGGSAWLSIISWLLTIYIIYSVFRSAFHYRMTECGGDITFGQSFRYIMWLFFFASIVAAVVRVIYLKWFDTTFLSNVMEQSKIVLSQLKFSAAERSMALESMEQMLQPVRFSIYYILYDLFMGLITALILSPLVKRKIQIENQD